MRLHKRRRDTFDCGTTLMTKQSFKDECDVNVVVRNHAQTGMWTHLNPINPTYGNFALATDLQEALAMVEYSETEFSKLPAEVRSACNNNPVELLQRLAHPGDAQILVDLGLPISEAAPPLEEQIAAGVAAGLAKTPEGDTPSGEEGQTA